MSLFSDRALLWILNKLCPGPHHTTDSAERDDEHTHSCNVHFVVPTHIPLCCCIYSHPASTAANNFAQIYTAWGAAVACCSGCAVDATAAAPQCMLSCSFPSLLSLAIIILKKEILRRRRDGGRQQYKNKTQCY